MWNSHSVGCLTGWIRKVEEEGMDEDGFIPESSRVIMTLRGDSGWEDGFAWMHERD